MGQGVNSFELKESGFRLDIRKKYFTLRVVKHWHKLDSCLGVIFLKVMKKACSRNAGIELWDLWVRKFPLTNHSSVRTSSEVSPQLFIPRKNVKVQLERLQYGCFTDSLNRNRRRRQWISCFTNVRQPDCLVGAGSKVQPVLSLL